MPFEQALGSNKQGKWDELLLNMFRDLLITERRKIYFKIYSGFKEKRKTKIFIKKIN